MTRWNQLSLRCTSSAARSLRGCCFAAGILLSAACAPHVRAVSPLNSDVTGAAGPLRPGDAVRLRIWREPDLSGDYPVDSKGFVVLPKLGERIVISESPEVLRRHLAADYAVFLRNPAIEVTILRRVTVIGAVRNPGVFSADPTLAMRDVIALAGGATSEGDLNRIELRRGDGRLVGRLSANSQVADLPLSSGDQIFVHERRWISRNPSAVGALLTASASLFVAMRLRR